MELKKLKYSAIIDKSTFEVLNSEFTKAKAYILYYGDNRNKSRMSKEAVEAAIPSLFNIPIVAEYIEKKEDFGTHGGKIIISDDGIEFIQTTKPYGLIPESSNPRWEMVDEKEYLVADILLWSGRYAELEKAIDVFSHQSAEINVFEGSFVQEDDIYDIAKFEFSALCLLGRDVEPCFEQSKVVVYGLDEFKQETDEMFKKYKEFALESHSAEPEVVIPETKIEFSVTYNQKREALQNAFPLDIKRDADRNIVYEERTWLVDFDDNYVFVEKSIWTLDNHECKYGRYTYLFDEVNLVATIGDEFEEMILAWLTLEENQKIQNERNDFIVNIKTLNTKIEEFEVAIGVKNNLIANLTEYKNKNEFENAKLEVEYLIEEFEQSLADNEEFKALKNNINNSFSKGELFMDIDDLENELFALIGRMKHKFSRKQAKKQNSSKVAVFENTINSNSGYFGSAEKYIKK